MATVPSRPVVEQDLNEILARPLPWARLAGSSVLVTGASGMLPSYVVYTLLALNDRTNAGITVHGLVRDGEKARRRLVDVHDRQDFRLLRHDVSQPVKLEGQLDYVIHGASPARPGLHASDPVGTIRANLAGTFNLLDLCVAKGTRAFLLMSSAETYGARPAGSGLTDEESYWALDPLDPRAAYSEGKRAAETICAAYQAQYGVTCRIPRFGHVYGPGMALDDGRVQADFAADVVAKRDITLNSDGSAERTYTYVADAIAGLFYVLLLGTETAYNVADARGLISIRGLAELFLGVRPERGLQLRFAQESDQRAYSQTKAQGLSSKRLEQLGWEPRVDLPTGLDRMVTDLEASVAAS